MKPRGVSFSLLIAWCLALALAACVTEFDLPTVPTASPSPSTPTPPPTATPPLCATTNAPTAAIPLGAPGADNNGEYLLNRCFRVTSSTPDECTLRVEGAGLADIGPGRALFLHQSQDGIAPMSGPTVTLNPAVLGSGDAGVFDVVTVASSSSLTSGGLLVNVRGWNLSTAYSSSGTRAAQACLMPVLFNFTVASGQLVKTSAFDAARGTGGIIAVEVLGSMSLQGVIDASGQGFDGGDVNASPAVADPPAETSPDTDKESGGGKGEGIDPRAFAMNGRGSRAGAGGGNSSRAGGGGGGNGGAGGPGGWESQTSDGSDTAAGLNTFGWGGGAVAFDPRRRAFFGGGGGAGHRTDNAYNPGGGSGGGIIFIRAGGSFSASGAATVRSNGRTGKFGFFGNSGVGPGAGGGGGGAGGTVVILSRGGSFNGQRVSASGGDGGDVTTSTTSVHQGPGGGGGGGVVLTSGFTIMPNSAVALAGSAGVNTFDQEPHRAGFGAAGRLIVN